MSVKINKLELENVKRVKAVALEPSENGLTIIGGNNRQGKTSILDAIMWALGGNRYKPSEPHREGSVLPPMLKVTLSNGLVVERKGKNSDLKVIDPSGNKAGQSLLDSFISELALNLPKFMDASSKEKAETLLRIIGVGDQLAELEMEESKLYNERHVIGQIADQKLKYAKEQPHYPDAPDELISISDLIQRQQEILARNGENQKRRNNLEGLKADHDKWTRRHDDIKRQLAELAEKEEEAKGKLAELNVFIKNSEKTVEQLHDESTAEIEESIANIESINIKVRANLDKEKAFEDAEAHRARYNGFTDAINAVRNRRKALLDGAKMPLQGLSVEGGELVYMGQKWDNMSGADRLITSTAIVRSLNPDCGFVLMDKLETMDKQTLEHFGAWLEKEGLQVIATRVSTGEECSIIIEDGYAVGAEEPEQAAGKQWKAGAF